METMILQAYNNELIALERKGNLRQLPQVTHANTEIEVNGRRMLNLSSNDYLGLATDSGLRTEFLNSLAPDEFLFSSSSSRLLTGNFRAYTELENLLGNLFGTESSLVFSSGYHMNTGILPAVTDSRSLILADKLVHASLIDGIRLSAARCIRYRHNNYEQLESLLSIHHAAYEKIIIVTESLFSMDGDEADLCRLVALKKQYSNVLLYVDEAHGIGVKGERGLGCAEEQGCISDIDFLTGTFGKALASVGAYLVCRKVIRDYLVNKMRTLIFTTALPPVNILWTRFVLERLESFNDRRKFLSEISLLLHNSLKTLGYPCLSTSHIIPMLVGDSKDAVLKAAEMQRKGFYVLPVRPPTVPEGTSRIRISLTANLKQEDISRLIDLLTD